MERRDGEWCARKAEVNGGQYAQCICVELSKNRFNKSFAVTKWYFSQGHSPVNHLPENLDTTTTYNRIQS